RRARSPPWSAWEAGSPRTCPTRRRRRSCMATTGSATRSSAHRRRLACWRCSTGRWRRSATRSPASATCACSGASATIPKTACSSSRTRPRRSPMAAEASRAPQEGAKGDGATQARSALLIDWGGVLTTNLFESFTAHCERIGIEPRSLRARFAGDPEARDLLIALEKGQLEEAIFEQRLSGLLECEPEGLIDGLFAGVRPDEAMLEAVRRARGSGVRTALVSNSWGVHRYPRELFEELFDGVVISAEEGIRKPSRRMYELGA